MKVSLSTKIIIISILIILAIVVAGSLTSYNKKMLASSNAWVAHTQTVLLKSEKSLSALKDIETGTRGFAITGDSDFLEPYKLSKGSILQSIYQLKKLTADNAAQQLRIDTLEKFTGERIIICEAIIGIRRKENTITANILPLVKKGKGVMDYIRGIVSRIEANENNLLVSREYAAAVNEKKFNATFYALFIAVALLFILIIFSFWYSISINKEGSKKFIQLAVRDNLFDNKMQQIINGISDPFFALDKNAVFTFINTAAKNKLGFDKFGLTGTNIFEAFSWYKDSETGKKIIEVLNTGKPETFLWFDEFLQQWYDVTIYPIDEGLTVYMKDTTERKNIETELLTAQQFLEETSQVAVIGGWDLVVDTGKIFWSQVTRDIHEAPAGYTPVLNDWLNFYKEGETRDTIMEAVTAAMEYGIGWDLELQITTFKGNEKWIRTKGKTTMEDGNCVRVFGTFQDIDKRKKDEQALEHERQLLKTLIDNIPVNIFIKDLDSKKLLINKKEMEYVGAANEEDILGKTDFELYPAETSIISVEEDRQVINTGMPIIDKETFNVKKDGIGTWFLTSKIPLRDAADKISGIIGISYDITERKKTEEKMRASEERFRLMFESSTTGIAVLNAADGSFIDINTAIADLFGYTKEALMQLHLKIITHPDDRHVNISSEESQQMIAGKIKTLTTTKRYLHKDGHVLHTELTTTMANDAAGKPLYVLFQIKEIGKERS